MKLFLAVATVTVMGLFQSSLLATLPWIIERTGLPGGAMLEFRPDHAMMLFVILGPLTALLAVLHYVRVHRPG